MGHFLREIPNGQLRKEVAQVRRREVEQRDAKIFLRPRVNDVRAVVFEEVERSREITRLVTPVLEDHFLRRRRGEGLCLLLDFGKSDRTEKKRADGCAQ